MANIGLKSRKFVINVGDEGAVVVYWDGKAIAGRYFYASPSNDEFKKVIMSDPQASVYLLADTVDQTFNQQVLPPVSSLTIGDMVRRRLKKEFGEKDISTARQISRNKTGRKDWNYTFISIRNEGPFAEWLDAFKDLPNRLASIHSLPIETESFVKSLRGSMKSGNGTKSRWELLVTHNKVGGFRQTVFKDGKLVFTRIAQPVGGNAPAVIAGNIEQETINTMEFIRRFEFNPQETLDIYIITSAEVKKELETAKLAERRATVLTPFEVAGMLGLAGSAQEKDRFADVVLAAHFIKANKAVIKFATPVIQQVNQYFFLSLAARAIAIVAVPAAIVYGILLYTDISALQVALNRAKSQLAEAKRTQAEVEQKHAANAERGQVVLGLIQVMSSLEKTQVNPLEFFSMLGGVKGEKLWVRDANVQIVSALQNATLKAPEIRANIAMDYYNAPLRIEEQIFENQQIERSFKNQFPEQEIVFSGFANRANIELSIDTAKAPEPNQVNKVTVTINGPLPLPSPEPAIKTTPEIGAPTAPLAPTVPIAPATTPVKPH